VRDFFLFCWLAKLAKCTGMNARGFLLLFLGFLNELGAVISPVSLSQKLLSSISKRCKIPIHVLG
jgi:hypothetical protein